MSETAGSSGRSDTFADDLAAACELARQKCCKSPGLPFVATDCETGEVISPWSVTATGNFVTDLGTGLVYAEALIQRSKQFPFGCRHQCVEAVLAEIVRKGVLGAIEQGFIGRFSMAAAAASLN
jgi:hypothetical protein